MLRGFSHCYRLTTSFKFSKLSVIYVQREFCYSTKCLQFHYNDIQINPERSLFLQIQQEPATIYCNNIVSSTRVRYKGMETAVTVRLGDSYLCLVRSALRVEHAFRMYRRSWLLQKK